MGAFLARHGKQLAFIPLLLLVGVLALRLVDTVRDDSDEDATGVDETAQASDTWQDDSADSGSVDATTPPRTRDRQGAGASGGGSTGGSGGSVAGGGGGSIGSGPTLTFTPDFSSGGSSSSGSSGGSTGGTGGTGGSTGSGGGGTGGDSDGTGGSGSGSGSEDGTGGGGTGGDGDETPPPSPSPSPSPTPEVDPDYNADGEVDLAEANKYCREEKKLGPLRPGWVECLNEAQNG